MKANMRQVLIIVAVLLAGILIGRGCAERNGSAASDTPDASEEAAVKFWTCSMHPEIQLPDPGQCPKCAMPLIPVMDSAEDEPTSLRELKLSPTAIALAEVETVPVRPIVGS